MCEIIDRAINDRLEKRVAERLAEEREETQKKMAAKLLEKQKMMAAKLLEKQKTMAAKLHKKGWSDEEIADFLDVELVDVRIWLDSVAD